MFWMIYWGCMMIFFGVIVLCAVGLSNSKNADNSQKQLKLNEKVANQLNDLNFNVSKKFYLTDYGTYNSLNKFKKMILVDDNEKNVCLIDYNSGRMFIVDYKDIINYEVYENGSNSTFGGGVGGFFGGMLLAETEGKCKDLRLIIRINKIDIPHIGYEIIENTPFNMGIVKSSKQYKTCITSLQEVVSFLEVLLNENKNNKEIIKRVED